MIMNYIFITVCNKDWGPFAILILILIIDSLFLRGPEIDIFFLSYINLSFINGRHWFLYSKLQIHCFDMGMPHMRDSVKQHLNML